MADNNQYGSNQQRVASADGVPAGVVAAQVAARLAAEQAAQAARARLGLPLYQNPHPIALASHGAVGVLAHVADYSFAEKAPLIPLTADEFPRASLDYPIVFLGEGRQPYAVAGLEVGHNQFIHNGVYRVDAYVPAYLRRYPFAFGPAQGRSGPALYLDHASRRVTPVGAGGAVPLFQNRDVTDLTRHAVGFCRSYQAAQARTTLMLTLLEAHGLFEPKSVQHTSPGASEPHLALEFFSVSPERVEALSDDVFLELRKAGALPVIHAQIASQARWTALAAALRVGA